jgi:hypothetical protein
VLDGGLDGADAVAVNLVVGFVVKQLGVEQPAAHLLDWVLARNRLHLFLGVARERGVSEVSSMRRACRRVGPRPERARFTAPEKASNAAAESVPSMLSPAILARAMTIVCMTIV